MFALSIRQRDLELLSAPNRREVRYVVIGGVAVQFYGCRQWNDVDDLDLLMTEDRANAERFLCALADENVLTHLTVHDVAQPGKQIQLKQPPLYTEDLTAKPEIDFDGIYSRSVETDKHGVSIRVVSLSDLKNIKRQMVDLLAKHQKDLECLESV